MQKIEPCWFGDRQIIYVRIERPDHNGPGGARHFVVYGHSLDKVVKEVTDGLAASFGWHGGGRVRKGRPPKARKGKR